ncbi:hypothetical protein ACF065_14855 [Streptomyces sp. NPDC015232]|uniref:hypothetical protein n=1 Tax=unclassified Streptomyces TaxID=2593676 RepID=UPI0036F56107
MGRKSGRGTPARLGPARLRALGLGVAVLIAVLVPVVASAGPAADRDGAGDAKPGAGSPRGLLQELGPHAAPSPAPTRTEDGTAGAAGVKGEEGTAGAGDASVTRCGPELASPDGVEAQTCVVTEGPDTWARTYYRNATGQELDAVLTLMAPASRTVQVRCAIAARDEPGTCETPRERGRGAADAHPAGTDPADAYTAVAEFAGTGEHGNAPLLLRSGSNTAEPESS